MSEQPYDEYCREILDPDKHFEKSEALDDIKVLDITNYILGPEISQYLALFGAEVIKVEWPAGDAFRNLGPYGPNQTVKTVDGKSSTGLVYLDHAANKHHIALDLHSEKAKEIIRGLVAKVDILVENFRPGTFDKLGIGYRELKEINPRLIYVWAGGWGQWGPYKDRPSYDPVGQCASGLVAITSNEMGGPPTKAGYWLCDHVGAYHGVIGVLTALWDRQKTGEGQMVEVCQNEAGMRMLDYRFMEAARLQGDHEPLAEGNWEFCAAPYGFVHCKDGLLWIGMAAWRLFTDVMKTIGKTHLIEELGLKTAFDLSAMDVQKRIYAEIEEVTMEKTVEEAEKFFMDAGIPTSRIFTPWDCINDPSYIERKTLYDFDCPNYGKLKVTQPHPRLSKTPGRIKWVAQPIGHETYEILEKYLGYTKEDVDKLIAEGISVVK
jgi:crotonobetainyl-CoA:carnitine CoA-transferase CaiB-like acyl-CoA transferase